MTNESWKNPWKLTAIGMALVIATVLVTGLVVANWKGQDSDKKVVAVTTGRAAPRAATEPAAPSAGAPTAGGHTDPVGDQHMQRVRGSPGRTAREDQRHRDRRGNRRGGGCRRRRGGGRRR